jgi:putative transferase (TIGR04331 family)
MTKSVKTDLDKQQVFLTRLDFNNSLDGIAVGAWCLSREQILGLESYDNRVLEYNSGRRSAVVDASVKVGNAYERLIPILTQGLNEYHNTSYSTRYWQILAGYWFRQYLDNLFERYDVLCHAHKAIPEGYVSLIPESKEWISTDTDAYSVALFSDSLNHQLFGQIIRARQLFKWAYDASLVDTKEGYLGRRKSFERIKRSASVISCIAGKMNRIVLLRTYFGAGLLGKISLRFRSIPLLGTPKLISRRVVHDWVSRNKLALSFPDSPTDFEILAMELLPNNIPDAFCERYVELQRLSEWLRPWRANLFMTANAFAANEIYKSWVAKAVEDQSASHIILQHGANYGHSEVMSEEEFEIDSCDFYLTTGWVDCSNSNVLPVVASSFLSGIGDYRCNKPIHCPDGDFIWVLASLPRYHYTQWSAAQGPNFQHYLRSQSTFLNKLDKKSRRRILCRGYHYDYGWGDLDFIEQLSFSFRIDRARKSLRDGIGKASLVVFTYDSTSMMESMAMNVPTICFWNPEYWGWRDEAKPLLKRLGDVGIYHEQPDQVAKFINQFKSTSDILSWWATSEVQQARNLYCNQYANTRDNEYQFWKNEIQERLK